MTDDTEPIRVSVQGFRADLADHLALVESGRTVIVTRYGRDIARVTSPEEARELLDGEDGE